MQIGLIGAGNMARGLARGWGRPVLCTDVLADRARALADELGGEALASNKELAERADTADPAVRELDEAVADPFGIQ